MRLRYQVVAVLATGGVKVLQQPIAQANDLDDFESMAEAKDYCDGLLNKGWRWPGAVALAVESIDGKITDRLYARPL